MYSETSRISVGKAASHFIRLLFEFYTIGVSYLNLKDNSLFSDVKHYQVRVTFG